MVYSAHWDHLGRDPSLKGNQIFSGALDNGSGVAVLLELAQAFAVLPPGQRARRSVLFLATTAEEKGLLGARYYVEHPLYSLTRTLADINMDGMNPLGRTADIEIVGAGASTIDDIGATVPTTAPTTLNSRRPACRPTTRKPAFSTSGSRRITAGS